MKKTLALLSLMSIPQTMPAMGWLRETMAEQLYFEEDPSKSKCNAEADKDLQQYADVLNQIELDSASYLYRCFNCIDTHPVASPTGVENIKSFCMLRVDTNRFSAKEEMTYRKKVSFTADKVENILRKYPYVVRFLKKTEVEAKRQKSATHQEILLSKLVDKTRQNREALQAMKQKGNKE